MLPPCGVRPSSGAAVRRGQAPRKIRLVFGCRAGQRARTPALRQPCQEAPTPKLESRRRVSTIQCFNAAVLLFCALIFPSAARAQFPLLDAATTRSSVSGQFIVIGADADLAAARSPLAITNAEGVRLQPALLAVIAERVKQPLWRALGLNPLSHWRGRIYLALHPAAAPDENVNIISTRLAGVWNYRVELPDVLARAHLARALAGVVLLELANRDNATGHAAEIPAWLAEGFARQLLADSPGMILSLPDQLVNGVPQNQVTVVERGVDPFAEVRPILQTNSVLTFEQLSWPDAGQLNGDDGGVYRASAQLFVNNLLALKDGPENLLAMLQMLPRCYNWQTAFRAAFAPDFPRPVDVEKWWALQAVCFATRGSGAQWTPAVSGDRLDELLTVPVETRAASNSLPVSAAVSFQTVIRDFDFARQSEIFRAELRDLRRAGWRMTPQNAALAEAYCRVLADYLGARNGVVPRLSPPPSKWQRAGTVKKLDALDAQRRAAKPAAPAAGLNAPR